MLFTDITKENLNDFCEFIERNALYDVGVCVDADVVDIDFARLVPRYGFNVFVKAPGWDNVDRGIAEYYEGPEFVEALSMIRPDRLSFCIAMEGVDSTVHALTLSINLPDHAIILLDPSGSATMRFNCMERLDALRNANACGEGEFKNLESLGSFEARFETVISFEKSRKFTWS